LTVSESGEIFIADYFNHRIRKVSLSGMISTIAGSGTMGFSGDGGLATSAQLRYPTSIAITTGNDVIIADMGNHRIRKIISANGNIITVAGTGFQNFSGVNGNITIVEGNYSGDGGLATLASLNFPFGVTVNNLGDIFFSDRNNHCVRKVDRLDGTISTIAGQGKYGNFYGQEEFLYPMGIAMSPNQENLYIADFFHNLVRRVNMTSSTYLNTMFLSSNANGTSVSFSLLSNPSSKQCLTFTNLTGYLKAFHITFTYDKPDYYFDAFSSDMFITARAIQSEFNLATIKYDDLNCFQWGGFDMEVI